MRGDIVYRIYGVHTGRDEDTYFGAFRTHAEAAAEIAKLSAREMHGSNWARQYHDRGFVVREATVETDFVIPPLPKPRDRYVVQAKPKPNRPGTWDSTVVEVLRRRDDSSPLDPVASYVRNYGLLSTFEPFRQRGREYALISREYTKTAVLDLQTGEVIAEEEETFYGADRSAPGAGFCPVGFYVPDWWDVNDDSIIPGAEYWNADREWPNGDFGFVWGCYWGDDSSWKVQYLDLRRIREGVIRREERFGYVALAADSHDPPWQHATRLTTERSKPPSFIRLGRHGGRTSVRFDVEVRFDLDQGTVDEDEREKVMGWFERPTAMSGLRP